MKTCRWCFVFVAAALSGCALSPPKPPLCDGFSKKPINERTVTPTPIATNEVLHGSGCTHHT